MTTKNFILATAGHVDHGKSSLVKALTGTDPDRLPEEKARKITIELGFAHLHLDSPSDSDVSFSVGVIDVPGHEDFVKNMVAGVGSIDLALLVVAADDGWMTQTEEHLEILTYLGVRRAVVALTKIDLVESEEAIENEVRNQLRDSPFVQAPIVRTSISTGEGLDDLKAQLAREFSTLEPPRNIKKPRLFVDRAFSLRGAGTIVTGTVCGGEFARGDMVVIQPGGDRSKIRTAQNHNREVDRVAPGTRAAFNLADIPVGMREKPGVRRGDIVAQPEFGAPDKAVDVVLLPRLRPNRKRLSSKHGKRVRVHHGSGSFGARLLFQVPDISDKEEAAIARLSFDLPVFFFAGDRLIIRDSSERATMAGAVVLDPQAKGTRFRGPAQRIFLAERARAPDNATIFVSTQITRDHAVARTSLLLQSRFGDSEIAGAVNSLNRVGKLVLLGNNIVDASWWTQLRTRAIALIDQEQARHPETAGVSQSRLESELAGEISRPEIFDALIADLCDSGFRRTGEMLRRKNHRPVLPRPVEAATGRIRDVLAKAKSDPPSRGALAPDAASQQALRFLRETSEIVELNGEIVLAAEQFATMRNAVIAFLKERNAAEAGELRQMLGSSRRVIIPFLERLDRDHVTRRLGSKRVLVKR